MLKCVIRLPVPSCAGCLSGAVTDAKVATSGYGLTHSGNAIVT